MMNNSKILVRMGEIGIAVDPDVLICIGLGSCIALALYESRRRIGSLGHIMLPDSSKFSPCNLPGKFADTAIEEMLKIMSKRGAKLPYIIAKIFGGADMFPSIGLSNQLSIGELNSKAVLQELEKRKVSILAMDIGGHIGRTIFFETATGCVVRKTTEGETIIY